MLTQFHSVNPGLSLDGEAYSNGIMILKREINPGLPRRPGESGFMNHGFGEDWGRFTAEPCERALFVNLADQPGYVYLGQYECTRVHSFDVAYWLGTPKKVSFFHMDSKVALAEPRSLDSG